MINFGFVLLFVQITISDRKRERQFRRANLIVEHDSKLNHTYVQEISESTGVKRKYLKVKVINTRNGIVKSCNAKLIFIEADSTVHRKPVFEDRILIWDNKKENREIGIDDYALLYIAFSQDTFQIPLLRMVLALVKLILN